MDRVAPAPQQQPGHDRVAPVPQQQPGRNRSTSATMNFLVRGGVTATKVLDRGAVGSVSTSMAAIAIIRMERKSHESRVLETNANLEEERTRMVSETNANIDALRKEFDKSIEDNAKMITKMNEEVANLKSVLESVRGEMDEKEREVRRAMEGREETEKLMEEMR